MTPYRHYTDAEIDAANDTDLPELLSHLGYQVRRVGNYYTTREMDSLRIKARRSWYRYSERLGGDAIAFMQHFCDMPFQEAVGYLLEFNGCSAYTSAPIPKRKPWPPLSGSGRPSSCSNRTAITSAYAPICAGAASAPPLSTASSRWACSTRARNITTVYS